MRSAPGPFPEGWPSRVALVAVRDPRRHPWAIDDAFDEIEAWLAASGRSVVYRVCQRRPAPDPATYIGRGKAEQLRLLCGLGRIEGVVVDATLTPSQRARLEAVVGRPVLDRGMWTRSDDRGRPDREADRNARSLHRAFRRARSCLNVVLVGCARAGKSTLFRALTGGPILPPSHAGGADARGRSGTRTRRLREAWSLGAPAEAVRPVNWMRRPVVLTDTPGLTYDIERDVWTAPPETVEEATEADLLLHVVDVDRPDATQRRQGVERALRGIGRGLPPPTFVVETQCDRAPSASSVTDECCFPPVAEAAHRRLSGITGFGCKALAERLIAVAARGDARPVARDVGAIGGEGECLLG